MNAASPMKIATDESENAPPKPADQSPNRKTINHPKRAWKIARTEKIIAGMANPFEFVRGFNGTESLADVFDSILAAEML